MSETFMEVIKAFLNEKGYLENENIEGVVFYGSVATGYATKTSDLDLQVITNSKDQNDLARGIDLIDGVRIEYFEKPISDYYARAIKNFKNQSNVLLSMIGHGVIIFDRNGRIHKLQEYIKTLYSLPMPCLSEDESKEMVSIINNRMIGLRTLYEHGDLYFNHLYHLTIEKIKKFYHRLYGFPEISTSKILKLYTDQTGYREAIFKTVPEQKFINLYINSLDLTNQKTPHEKMNAIEELYSYAKRDVHLNENNYKIRIKSRN